MASEWMDQVCSCMISTYATEGLVRERGSLPCLDMVERLSISSYLTSRISNLKPLSPVPDRVYLSHHCSCLYCSWRRCWYPVTLTAVSELTLQFFYSACRYGPNPDEGRLGPVISALQSPGICEWDKGWLLIFSSGKGRDGLDASP